MMRGKTGLDDLINERLRRQAKKSSSQLSTLKFLKTGKKVADFSAWSKPDPDLLEEIPGRTKPNKRAEELRKKQQDEKLRLERHQTNDWTPTDQFGNLDISLNVQVLQVNGLPDPSAERNEGPIYVQGKRIEGLDLAYPVELSRGTTFEILKPRKRYTGAFVSVRHALAGREDGEPAGREYQLEEAPADAGAVDRRGALPQRFVHLNAVALTEDSEFAISRAVPRSSAPRLLDLYGNFVSESSALYLSEQLAGAVREDTLTAFQTLSLSCNPLGPAAFPSLGRLLTLSTALTSLSLCNLFDPLTDLDGATLAEGLRGNQGLTFLDLSGNCLANQFAWAMRDALRAHTALQTLSLECNLLSDDASFFLAEGLLKNPANALRALRLGWNRVGHVGFGCLMEAAGAPHSRLAAVDFRHNDIVRLDSGAVTASIARTASLTALNLSHNRLADMTELGLGLHANGSLTELSVAHNLLADDSFRWFALWQKPQGSALRSIDLTGNKLGDAAAACIVEGLSRHRRHRVLTRVALAENLIDPLLAAAVAALLNPVRPDRLNRQEARTLLRAKRDQERRYWRERDWEARQKRREAALDAARRLLERRAPDEVETDTIVGAPFIARVPVVSGVMARVHEWLYGVRPPWQLQKEILREQHARVAKDVALRRGLQKGADTGRPPPRSSRKK